MLTLYWTIVDIASRKVHALGTLKCLVREVLHSAIRGCTSLAFSTTLAEDEATQGRDERLRSSSFMQAVGKKIFASWPSPSDDGCPSMAEVLDDFRDAPGYVVGILALFEADWLRRCIPELRYGWRLEETFTLESWAWRLKSVWTRSTGRIFTKSGTIDLL